MSEFGTVKSFVQGKGYGFIEGPDGQDVFLYIKEMADGSIPAKGDMVAYEMEPSPTKPGQMIAKNVHGGTGTPIPGIGKGGDSWGAAKGESWGGGGKSGPYGGGGGKGGGFNAKHVPTGTITGEVKSFVQGKGYGFIVGPDGQDVFVHQRDMADGSIPTRGDIVTYDTEPSPSNPGQMVAKNVAGGTGTPMNFGKGDKGGDSWGGGKGDGWGADGGGKGDKMGKMMDMMMSMMDSWGGGGGGEGGKGGGW